MHRDLYWYKGLPHLQPLGGTSFLTTRLAGSVPQEKKVQLTEQYALEKRQILAKPDRESNELDRLEKRYFVLYEAIVDKAEFGPRWLAIDSVARAVADTMHFGDNKSYELIA